MSDFDDDMSSTSSPTISFPTTSSEGGGEAKIDTIQSVNIWKIHGIHFYMDPERICSIQSYKFAEGYVKLYTRGMFDKYQDFIGLSLFLPCNAKVRYRFSIIDQYERPYNIVEGDHYFQKNWNQECIIPEFISRTHLMDQNTNLIVNDVLTIAIELDFEHTYELDCQNHEHKSVLSKNLQTLFDNPEFSDIKLQARGNKILRAHKNILAARSSVFAAMFRHKMKETMENIVAIKDVKIKVLKEMLYYMYTGTLKDVKNMKTNIAQDLLIVAEKYDIPGLKKISGKVLEKKLTINNAIDTLIFADSHNAIELKKNTVDYLAANIKEVMETKSFKNALNSNLSLVINTIEKVINLRIV